MTTIPRALALYVCLLLSVSNPPPTVAGTQQQAAQGLDKTSKSVGQENPPASTDTEKILPSDEAEIVVFNGLSIFDESTLKATFHQVEVVYNLQHTLAEGRFQVFNDLKIEAEYPLPDLTAGKHITSLPLDFYWSEKDESLPESQGSLFCYLGTTPINDSINALWQPNSEPSAYDYKPEPADKEGKLPPGLEDEFRGDDVGFSEVRYPFKHNLELRKSGDLPEIEILGVGFVEGTKITCGRGVNPKRVDPAPLRDIRVMSAASHDTYDAIPVLKAGRFTVPKPIFQYPSHIRIVGKRK